MFALFAVLAFALLLVAAFVIDVANWQEHRRHLQVQVDDGATATGTYFTNCFIDPAGSNANIQREARKFAGDPNFQTSFPGHGTPYNLQIDDPSRVVLNLNRPDWPPPGTDFDPTYDLDPAAAGIQNTPCESKTLLVRAKDVDVPTFFGGVVPGPARLVDVRAKARVEIDKVIVMKGFLPWAVPEVKPQTVAALFVNEANPAGSPPSLVAKLNLFGSQTLNGESVDLYTRDVTVGEGSGGVDYGVVIALSNRVYDPDGQWAGQPLTTICALPAVTCYTGSTQTSGLDFIHGYPRNMGSDGSPSGQVKLEGIELLSANTSCDNSSPYFQWKAGCVFKLRAQIDFGALTPQQSAADVKIQGPGCGGGGCTLTLDAGWWESPASLSLNDGSGRGTYDITWKVGNGNCNRPPPYCGGTSKIIVPFSATDDPGANGFVGGIRYVGLKTGGTFANSLGPGNHTVTVQVGVQPPLRVTALASDPPIMLRFASKSGSLNQALDCDHPNLSLEDEVRDGCQTYYARNQRDLSCTGPPGPTWTSSNLPPSTFIPASGNINDAPDCVAAKTGDVTAMAKGLHDRFEGPPASCPPNHWIQFRDAILHQQPLPNDPRYVTLIVTEFSAFSGSGSTVVPVRVHAGFYVTGWFHQQTAVGCPDNDLPPPPAGNGACLSWPNDDGSAACDPASSQNKGNVWGYFVTTVLPVPGGIVSEERCEFGELGTCAARLVE
jgi:hypothetical protein